MVKLLLVFGARVNSLDSQFQTPLDVAVECSNERAIVMLQKLGGVQGELVKAHHFSTGIPRLNTIHDVAKMKAQVVKLRSKARKVTANRNAYYEPEDSAVDVYAGINGSAGNVGGQEDTSGDAKTNGSAGPVGNGYMAQGNSCHTPGGSQVNGCGLHIGNDKESFHKSGDTLEQQNANMGVCLGLVNGEELRERLFSNQSLSHVTLRDMEDGNTLSTLYERLQQCINMTYDLSGRC